MNKPKKRLLWLLEGFQESTDALPDATVVLDDNGKILWWNAAATEILGLDRKAHKLGPIDAVIHDPVFHRCLDAEDYHQPLQIPAPSGLGITLELRIVPYGRGKRLLQARDITRLQQLETVRRDFVANVSHEMRTPLTVVHGYLEMLVDTEDERLAPWRPIISQMHKQTSRMQRIVEDLLLLARLDASDNPENQERVEILPLLASIREEALELSSDDQHQISLEAQPGLNLTGNNLELHSAFANLVYNAVRYSPPRSLIEMCWRMEKSGPCFSVQDRGIGIERQHLPRLTERFYRVDVGRSRQSGGTGLGLAIVKHVLNRHGGQLLIESEVGQGSTFSCCFSASAIWRDPDSAPVTE